MTKAGIVVCIVMAAVLVNAVFAYAVAIYQAGHYMKQWEQ